MAKLNELQIRFMMSCLNEKQFSRSKLSNRLKKWSLVEKELAVNELINLGLINKEIKKNLSEENKTTKHPIFYSLTEDGLKALKEFAISDK